jgi:hypothetical protein
LSVIAQIINIIFDEFCQDMLSYLKLLHIRNTYMVTFFIGEGGIFDAI